MLKLGNLLRCKSTRQRALQAKARKELEAAGEAVEQAGDANNQEIDKLAESNNKLVETTESVQRPSGDVDTSITSPKRYSTNIAYPFNDAKSTSFPPPLSIEASVVTEKTQNDQRVSDRSYVTPRTSEVASKRTSILSRKSADRGDQISTSESFKPPEEEQEKDRCSKDVGQDVCTLETCRNRVYTLETCVGPSTHKSGFVDEIDPSKLTEMINTSIKEAMQTIVKDCSIIPTAQDRKLSVASSKEASPKRASDVAPKRTPDVAPKRTSDVAPKRTSDVAAKKMSELASKKTSDAASKRASDAASKRASDVGSKRTSDVASKRASEAAPKKASEVEATCHNINRSICQSSPRPAAKVKCPSEPRTIKEQCNCVTLSTIRDIAERGKSHNSSRYNRTTRPCRIESTCGLTSMKLPTANDNDAAKKSKRQTTRNVKTDNRCDNRRMTGNVNIYICSEANEGTQVTKKKKPKSPPCTATDSETTTEQSAVTCVRSADVSSSKLVNSIRKKRQAMKDQQSRNLCYSNEKSESQCITDESSNVESCTTEFRNCRLIAEKDSNDDDVRETVSSVPECQNSMSTLSTRDGCCCKGTIVSGTDLLVKQSESFPRSRFTTCVKETLVPCSTLYPTKDVNSDDWIEGSDYDVKQRTREYNSPQNVLNSESSDSSRQLGDVNYDVYRDPKNVYSPRNLLSNNYRIERESEIRNAKARRNSYVNDVCAFRHKEPRTFSNNYGNECKSTTRWRKGERRSFGSSKETIQHWSACNCIAEEEEDYCYEEKKLEDIVEKDVAQKFTVCGMSKGVYKENKALNEKVICVKVYDDTLPPEKDDKPMKRLSKVIDNGVKQRNMIQCPVKDIGEISKSKKRRSTDVKRSETASRLAVNPRQREELHNELKKRVSENILKNETTNNDTKGKENEINEKAKRENSVNNDEKLIVDEPKVEVENPTSLDASDDKPQDNSNPLKTILQPKIRSVLSGKAVDIKNKFRPKPVPPTVEQPIVTEEEIQPSSSLKRPSLVPQKEDTENGPEVQSEEIARKKLVETSLEKNDTAEKPITLEKKPAVFLPIRILKKVLTLIKRRRNVPAIKMDEGTNTVNDAVNKDIGARAKTDSIISTKLESKLSLTMKDETASEITKPANKVNGANNEAGALTEESAAAKSAHFENDKATAENEKLVNAERRESIRKEATLNKLKIPKTKLRSIIESAKKASGLKVAADKAIASTKVKDRSHSQESDSNENKQKQESITQKPEEEAEAEEEEKEEGLAKDKDDVRKISQDKRAERHSSISNNVECPEEQPTITSVPSHDYCYQPKVECQCEPSRHSTYCVRPTRQVPCDAPVREKYSLPMHPIHIEYCNMQQESDNTLIIPCISYQSPQSNYRCSRPIGRVCRARAREECSCSGPIETVGRRLRPKDECKCRRSMICIYCENPRERCTCSSPIRKCSSCSLPLDICECRPSYDEADDARRRDQREKRPIIGESQCETRKMICVTAWKPKREIRRYFERGRESVFSQSRDEYRYRQKLKPYGSEELPYQRSSAFSDVMNELQQKISGSMSCTCCRKVPCCCELNNERCEEIEERNMKSGPRPCRRVEQPSPICNCAVNPPNAAQRRPVPTIRACYACNGTPCNCRKNKINQRKPRAKCYYCKSLPCTCIGTKETSKPRPCRCADSPGRVREKEIVPCGNSIVCPKDNDGKFLRTRDSSTRVCSPPKRHQRHDNPVCVPLPEEKCR